MESMSIKIRWQIGMILATVMGIVPLVQALGPALATPDIPKEQYAHDDSKQEIKSATVKKDTSSVQTTPPPSPTPVPPPKPPPIPPSAPSQVLDLTNWKLTLPINTDHSGNPDEIIQPELAAFSLEPYFLRVGNSVVFRANAGGATTSNSGYPRSELREMTNNGRDPARWSNTQGVHTMTIRQAITHLPDKKPHVVAGQIHDDSDDVIEIRLEGTRLFVESDGKDVGLLDANYVLGAVFTVQVIARDGHIYVHYNGEPKVDYDKKGSDYYFKAGCYTQSNTKRGDDPNAYGEVIIYGLQVSHS